MFEKPVTMSDHSELVAEIASVEKMATQDRLKHAKKRRNQQMKRWANYERQLEKDKSKKGKQSSNQRRHRRQRVRFIHNIMLLEAAARNDVEEGKITHFKRCHVKKVAWFIALNYNEPFCKYMHN